MDKPGPDFVKVKVRFGQVGDEVGQGQVWPVGDLVGQDQGQELDNMQQNVMISKLNSFLSVKGTKQGFSKAHLIFVQ